MSILLIGTAFIPLLSDLLIPQPLRYQNSPFPVCQATSTKDNCVQIDATYAFQPGMVVPLLVSRCYDEPFASPDKLAGYRIDRSLVSDHDGITITMAATFNQSPFGCSTEVLNINAVPLETPDGVYHFEGQSTLYGTFRTGTAIWRTENFAVRKEGSRQGAASE